MSYPSSIDSFTTKTDNVDTVQAAHVNLVQAAIVAIETELGTAPSGNYASVKSALDNFRDVSFGVELFGATADWAAGDGKAYVRIPQKLDGFNILTAAMACLTPSTSGIPTVQIARGRQAGTTAAHSFQDVLSTKLTIDVNEYDSLNATTAAVVNTSYDDLATGDILRFDCDVAGTGTKGGWVSVTCRKPA